MVPLARQALSLLSELKRLTGAFAAWVFSNEHRSEADIREYDAVCALPAGLPQLGDWTWDSGRRPRLVTSAVNLPWNQRLESAAMLPFSRAGDAVALA